ncbi:F-box protein FBW2-like [Impatiens glandulifera]|uniref:F-box protein FBW2-like n=1 Tax=Impatiens glandulifera TaxID=253017 RepID=UPI001FB12DFC|nr:F-box protein FBW2-like [Impatiens glandulifera]
MEEDHVNDHRGWDQLLPDTLGLIFCKLSLKELLTVVPIVCKSWDKVVKGPFCWQEIDILDWCNNEFSPEKIDRMVRMLITRSGGSLRKLYVCRLQGDPIFSFIADNARCLQILVCAGSDMSNDVIEMTAGKFSSLTSLDLSYCLHIGDRALEAIGKNCRLLSSLRRNMYMFHMETFHNEEARAIAGTMRKLKHLEIRNFRVETNAVLEIIAKCGDLELLDVRGCHNLNIDHLKLKNKFHNLMILGPCLDLESFIAFLNRNWVEQFNTYIRRFNRHEMFKNDNDDGHVHVHTWVMPPTLVEHYLNSFLMLL